MKKLVLLTLVLSSMVLFSCKKKEDNSGKQTGTLSTVPAFSIPSMWGDTCTPKDYAGKPAIVEIWSMRCPHCRTQAKYLEELATKLDFAKYAIVSIHAGGGEKMKDQISAHFKNKK
ncbi:TlpA family protein disulfide reductase, partial [Myxococcota bacterium]|nr:TlpA family protein disulfide reductase [Myxococcota bacterium]